MPGFDGTGPGGRGPMTGRGSGYCIMKKSEDPDPFDTGFAGLSGKPVISFVNALFTDTHSLNIRMQHIHLELRAVHRRVKALEMAHPLSAVKCR